jgi:hypothetical protein
MVQRIINNCCVAVNNQFLITNFCRYLLLYVLHFLKKFHMLGSFVLKMNAAICESAKDSCWKFRGKIVI